MAMSARNMFGYSGLFALFLLLLSVGLGLLMYALERFLGLSPPVGVSVITIMLAAILTVQRFITDYQRILMPGEMHQLVWLSFLAAILVSAFIAAIWWQILPVFAGSEMAAKLRADIFAAFGVVGPGLMLAGAGLFSMIVLAMLYFTYGFLAGRIFDGMKKRGEI